jgi:zinc D-Ala-D-Ala carboxypeptidase
MATSKEKRFNLGFVSVRTLLDGSNDYRQYSIRKNNMKYFKLSEFDSPDMVGSGEAMDKEFLSKLDQARSLCDIPFRITSGYRSKAHNLKVGGVSNSSHIKGLAADIACTNSAARHIIVSALLKVGLNRIGIADTFIHVDRDPSKVANVIWTY